MSCDKPNESPSTLSQAPRKRRAVDELIVAALATGSDYKAAAAAASVSRKTVCRRMKDPKFREQVNQQRLDLVERSLANVADGMIEAAQKLRQLLKAESESIQLGAARSLLEFGTKLRDAVEIERRLMLLESKLTERELVDAL